MKLKMLIAMTAVLMIGAGGRLFSGGHKGHARGGNKNRGGGKVHLKELWSLSSDFDPLRRVWCDTY